MGGGVAVLQSDGQFLCQSFAEAGLASPWRSVEQNNSVAGDDIGVNTFVRQEERGLDELHELGLYVSVVD